MPLGFCICVSPPENRPQKPPAEAQRRGEEITSATSSFNPIGAMAATDPALILPAPRNRSGPASKSAPPVWPRWAPLLQKRELQLIELPADNFELATHKGLLVKDSYWRWTQREWARNTIDPFKETPSPLPRSLHQRHGSSPSRSLQTTLAHQAPDVQILRQRQASVTTSQTVTFMRFRRPFGTGACAQLAPGVKTPGYFHHVPTGQKPCRSHPCRAAKPDRSNRARTHRCPGGTIPY